MIRAIYQYPDNGYELDRLRCLAVLLEVGKSYEVEQIDMGHSHTNVYLKGYEFPFNSVSFEFEEDGKPLDIFSDRRFNPYLK